MKRVGKKGLSGVITTLILILLTLVAVGVIWVVIANVINEGTEEIDIGKFTLNLEIEKVVVTDTGFDVIVKRNPGKGEINGLKFVVSDGTDSEVVEVDQSLNELEKKTISVPYDGLVKSVGVVPTLKGSSGNVISGDLKDTFEFDNADVVKNIPGLVSWWRFEGNANDEMGSNDGTLINEASFVEGIYGEGVSLDGDNDYVTAGNDESLNPTQEITVSVWVNSNTATGSRRAIWRDWANDGSWVLMKDGGTSKWFFGLVLGGSQRTAVSDNLYTDYVGEWTHLVGTYDGNIVKLYVNGVEQLSTTSYSDTFGDNSPRSVFFGATTTSFNGTIDEYMIFDKALTADHIEDLYHLDLN